MKTQIQLTNEVSALTNTRTLIRVFEDLAAAKMNQTRKTIAEERDFNQVVSQMYAVVTNRALEKRRQQQKSPTDSKEAVVLITTGTGLHGTIIGQTFSMFRTYVNSSKRPDQVFILGATGEAMVTQQLPDLHYTAYAIHEEGMDAKTLAEVMEKLIEFDLITVFHGKFVDISHQQPTGTVIDSKNPPVEVIANETRGEFLFEPSLDELDKLFRQEILGTIFQHTISESSLGAHAARFIQLDAAIGNIDNQLNKLNFDRLQLSHQIANRKQSTRVSRIKLLRK